MVIVESKIEQLLVRRRYVDDTSVVCDRDEQAQHMLKLLNDRQPNVTFTMKSERDDTLAIVDFQLGHSTDGPIDGREMKDVSQSMHFQSFLKMRFIYS